MGDACTERIEELFASGHTDEEISAIISDDPGIQGQISSRTVRRRRAEIGLYHRKPISESAVDILVRKTVSEIGGEPGRRFIRGHFRNVGYPVVGEQRIAQSLKRTYPGDHMTRQLGASRRTNPLRYVADYFGDKIHMDQNEKACMYGLTYVGAIDGYSGYILDCVTMPVKNPILIYDILFKPIVQQYGVWNTVVTDMGREFSLSLAVQESLRDFRRKTDVSCSRQVVSTMNNRIERYWVENNSRITYPIKRILVNMENRGTLDLADPIHRHACSTISMEVANVGLQRHIGARNNRYVQGRGVPARLKGENTAAVVSPNLIPSTAIAARQYRDAGGTLTEPAGFGSDPLASRIDLQGARSHMMARYDPTHVYASCLTAHETLSDFLQDYIQATIALSHHVFIS